MCLHVCKSGDKIHILTLKYTHLWTKFSRWVNNRWGEDKEKWLATEQTPYSLEKYHMIFNVQEEGTGHGQLKAHGKRHAQHKQLRASLANFPFWSCDVPE